MLTELLIPTQKLLLAESSSTQRYNWELVSTWPRVAKLLSNLGAREKAKGYLQYQVKNYYGYDLARQASWSLKREGTKIIFEAPPLRLLTCPAVLTQSLMFVVEGGSPFVGELSRQDEVIRVATAQALAVAHEGLRDPDKFKRIKETADQDLKSLLMSLARPMGWDLKGADIVITNPEGQVDLPPPWQPALGAGGNLDLTSVTQLKNAGCM
ncbi:hypothetical protein ASE11_09005 [Hydrogenophaga sp. Root209]|uniref:hypothetical protein n=1 Tax=Hydrogenophaga sp. Root209 TaxID=1736490 RepID=UPI0006F9D31A|nr:hypothetical protein [Hydrogenophaga sp. Root209]KRB99800.1 hypothetical protein ASE11_09005 [Hydrogenophaga sp. Root209]